MANKQEANPNLGVKAGEKEVKLNDGNILIVDKKPKKKEEKVREAYERQKAEGKKKKKKWF